MLKLDLLLFLIIIIILIIITIRNKNDQDCKLILIKAVPIFTFLSEDLIIIIYSCFNIKRKNTARKKEQLKYKDKKAKNIPKGLFYS